MDGRDLGGEIVMCPLLEDFGRRPSAKIVGEPGTSPKAPDRFDEGYNAGWDDAMARLEEEQARIGEELGRNLMTIERDHLAARQDLVADLEPALRDIFDKLLPHAVERSFLSNLLEEVDLALAATTDQLCILVSPEELAPMLRLLERADIPPTRAHVIAEPALALSQAMIRWSGQERRLDLEGVLTDLDAALDTYFSTLDRTQNAPDAKEA